MASGIGGLLGLLGIAALLGGLGGGRGDPGDSEIDDSVFGDRPRGLDFFPFTGDPPGLGSGFTGGGGSEVGGGGVDNIFAPDDSLDPGGQGSTPETQALPGLGTDVFEAPIIEATGLPATGFEGTIPSPSTPSSTFAVTPINEPPAGPSSEFAVTPINESAPLPIPEETGPMV